MIIGGPLVPALLALSDGSVFHGCGFGAVGSTVGEVVFNTSMTGYQEILTDPSYSNQLVVLTASHIGNTGANLVDVESDMLAASGLIIRSFPHYTSSWRSEMSLHAYLQQKGRIGIADIDTRQLTHCLREQGAMPGCLMAGDNLDEALALEKARSFSGLKGMDLAKEVSVRQTRTWDERVFRLIDESVANESLHHVVVYDLGVKHNILRLLVERCCKVTVVHAQTPPEEVLSLEPDGVLFSNGPGDPEPCQYAMQAVRFLAEHGIPILGICLGHQIISLAFGAKSIKMKVGHHGANHPVQDLATKQVFVTSQNHGFVIDKSSLSSDLEMTHTSLFDNTLQGIRHRTLPILGFQGHPEASPGPHDASGVFDTFINNITRRKSK